MLLQCCLCPSACCDLHAVCQSPCNAVGLDVVEQQYDAVMNQSLIVSAMLYNADEDAVLLMPICCL